MSYVSFANSTQGETRRVGGYNLGPRRGPGPRRAFTIKKLKLNTKSPHGGGGLKSLALRGQLPRLASRAEKICVHRGLIFSAEIKRIQTHAQQRQRTWGTCRRRDGVGGLNHWPGGRRKPPWLYSEIFFCHRNFSNADFPIADSGDKLATVKCESNQRLRARLNVSSSARCCARADLFAERPRNACTTDPKNCREIRGGGYGR